MSVILRAGSNPPAALAAFAASVLLWSACSPSPNGVVREPPMPDFAVEYVGSADLNPCIDTDGDGYGEGCANGPDCNDADRSLHPGAPEYCDEAVDRNCNGMTGAQDASCL